MMDKEKNLIVRKKIVLIVIVAIIVAVILAGGIFYCSFFPNFFAQSISADKISDGAAAIGDENSILIAYFSSANNREYNTQEVDAVSSASLTIRDGIGYGHAELFAMAAQETTGGDLFPIQVSDKYPQDYFEVMARHRSELETDVRPELAMNLEQVTNYKTVILIYPNWMNSTSHAVLTFLESNDFTDMTIIPIATSQALGLGSGPDLIEKACPNAIISKGLSARSEKDITDYLKQAGLAQ